MLGKFNKRFGINGYLNLICKQIRKMEYHSCLFCMGSNRDKEANLKLARQLLTINFPVILFGEEMVTEPIFFSSSDLFLNQVGYFVSSLSVEEIKEILKEIEEKGGKNKCDKLNEIVRLDIDLLMYDSFVLKPKDMKYPYVRKGIEELQEKICNLHMDYSLPFVAIL